MLVEVSDWCRRPEDDGRYCLVGWYWFRNGNWSARYDDGRRLFYFYVGPILFNRALILCVQFPTLFMHHAESV